MIRSAVCVVVLSCCWCIADSAYGQNPPFAGTAFLRDTIITEADWSAFDSMTYAGLENRQVFDRRVNQWLFQPMHLFDATFFDGLTSEMRINPEFGDSSAAAVEAEKYALVVGRLPTSLRTDVDSITVHKGFNPFGGGNQNILIHTDQADQYGDFLEEVLFHEAGHTSYDADHKASPGWLSAQQNDPTFISTYARDNPTREDVAESILPWYALRYSDVLYPFQIEDINEAIPNRLAYFDALPFQLNQPPGLVPGDFNGDGVVNDTDLPFWQAGFGMASGATASDGDADFDGDVDGNDFLTWQNSSASASELSSAITGVPEPGTLALLVSALSLWTLPRRKVHVRKAARGEILADQSPAAFSFLTRDLTTGF